MKDKEAESDLKEKTKKRKIFTNTAKGSIVRQNSECKTNNEPGKFCCEAPRGIFKKKS